VPVEEPADLGRIVRIAPGPSGARVLRPDLGNLSALESQKWLRLLEPVHVRALLFAPAVIFCEGMTEVKALPPWWRHARKIGLRDPEAANIPVIGVDGPALRKDSDMAEQLAKLGRFPSTPPAQADDFAGWRRSWEDVGVFSLQGSEVGLDRVGPGGTGRGEAQLDQVFLRPGAELGALAGGQVVHDRRWVRHRAGPRGSISARPGSSRRPCVTLAAAVDTPQGVVAHRVAAVEVGHPMGAVAGGGPAIGVSARSRPAGSGGGADAERTELAEREDAAG
jgi:hypothetical protein